MIRRRQMVLRLPAMSSRVGLAGSPDVTPCGRASALFWMTGSRRGRRAIRPNPWRAIGSQVRIGILVRLH
jgi:hypothetical protein